VTRIKKISSFIIRDCERKETRAVPKPMIWEGKRLRILNRESLTIIMVLQRKNMAGAKTILAFLNLTILNYVQQYHSMTIMKIHPSMSTCPMPMTTLSPPDPFARCSLNPRVKSCHASLRHAGVVALYMNLYRRKQRVAIKAITNLNLYLDFKPPFVCRKLIIIRII